MAGYIGRSVTVGGLLAVLGWFAFAMPALHAQELKLPEEGEKPSVFDLPRRAFQVQRLQQQTLELMADGKLEEAEARCRESIVLLPQSATGHYNLGCVLARRGMPPEAFEALHKAVEFGFRDSQHIEADADLESLRSAPEFAKLLDAAKKPFEPDPKIAPPVQPAKVVEGRVEVSTANTGFDGPAGVFRSMFELPAEELKQQPAVQGNGELGERIRAWQKEGTAGGLWGIYYDNHDGDHSPLGLGDFPQLTAIRFSKEAADRRLSSGLQLNFFYNRPTFGNSSTALVNGPFWRSQTRLAMSNPRTAGLMYLQYITNHLYFYPEHRDYDPGHNGPDGFGDVFPAHTPYVFTSQGSSGSDQAFLHATTLALAALHPDTKKTLIENGLLAPTLQMLLRRAQKSAASDEGYLSGKSHRVVFDSANLESARMVELAHSIKPTEVPPIAQIRVVDEDQGVAGRDWFESTNPPGSGEKIFDTPCAVARVHRTFRPQRRMVISADASRDANRRPLTFHWVLLQGDPAKVTIKPDAKGDQAEIVIQLHDRFAIEEGSPQQSNRVDVAVFAHNGAHHSAPAIISTYFLDNELRTYDDQGRLLVMDYDHAERRDNYTDPAVDAAKRWRDEYHYNPAGALTGWTRHRGDEKQDFIADGSLILQRDPQGRPVEAQTVRYVVRSERDQRPLLLQQPGGEVLIYAYADAADPVGKVVERRPFK